MAFLSCFCSRSHQSGDEEEELPPPRLPGSNTVVEVPVSPIKDESKDKAVEIASVKDATHRVLWEAAATIVKSSSHLTKGERALLDEHQGSDEAIPLLATITAAQDARQKHLDSRMTYSTRNGEVIVIRERFDRLLKGFQSYTRMIDVAAGASDYALVVWGAMRFFFQIFWNKIEILEHLETALAQIITAMATSQVYQSVYSQCQQLKGLQQHQSGTLATENMEQALPRLCAAVLIFAIKTRIYFQTIHSLAGVASALKPFNVQFKPYLDDIAQKQKDIETLANMATAMTVQQSSTKLQTMFSLLRELKEHLGPWEKVLNDISSKVQEIRETVSAVRGGQEREVDEKALQWLDAQNPKGELAKNQFRRLHGTCEWIKRLDDYQAWKTGGGPHSLWVSGRPGKTVLASFLIQDLQADQDVTVLYFFFKQGDMATSSPIEALSSLILQLIHLANERSPGLQRRLVAILKKAIDKGAGFADRGKTNFPELQAAFASMLREFDGPRMIVVLDALDECLDPGVLVEACLESPICEAARFIITSRPTQDIVKTLGSSPKTCTIQMNVEADIKFFVESKVSSTPSLKRHQAAITSTVTHRASGMFRLAALLIDELLSPSPDSVSKRLKNLPTELGGMYEAILARLGSVDLELRRMVLAWIATARRPPTVDEIAYAFATLPFDKSFDPDDKLLVTDEQILKSCGSLVELFNGDELRFTHLTVREFLTAPPRKGVVDTRVLSCLVKTADVEVDMAARCLTQVSSRHFSASNPGQRSPFDYALVHWVYHASAVLTPNSRPGEDTHVDQLEPLLLDFVWGSPERLRHWLNSIPPYERDHRGRCLYLPKESGFAAKVHPFHVAASYGLDCILDHPNRPTLVAQDLNVGDGRQCTPLIWAASNRQVGVVTRLIREREVDVNAVNMDGRSALTIGSENGFTDIVELLLTRNDLDINIRDSITHQDHSCNALSWAAWKGHLEVVRLLLTRQDLEPERLESAWGEMPLYFSGDLPLHHATYRGHAEIVELLLGDSRVNINARSRKDYTPLQVACRIGNTKLVQLLLDHGADASLVDIDNDTARDCALDNGHNDIVQILDDARFQTLGSLDRAAWLGDGAALEELLLQDDFPPSQADLSRALSYACERGHVNVVQTLLNHQDATAEPESRSASALLWPASWRGDEAMISLLLGRPGIDVNCKNPNGRTALSLAAQKGHHPIVRALLARPEVDINTQDKSEDTPLVWAAYHGHADVVRALVADPAIDVNVRNNYRDVALNYAVRYGHADVVRLLLAAPGVDINTSSLQSNAPIHETALFAPASDAARRAGGHNECLKLLLAREDLKVNVQRETGDTVLSIAVGRGFDDQVAMLLSREDLDRQVVNKKGEMPLSTAKWLGYDKIVALLEQNEPGRDI
ncbi:ankyrin repeat-containing domain protein [Podospora conica]|nr:ankyrin repeat-containing domain protein [Schizothecium conicum]